MVNLIHINPGIESLFSTPIFLRIRLQRELDPSSRELNISCNIFDIAKNKISNIKLMRIAPRTAIDKLTYPIHSVSNDNIKTKLTAFEIMLIFGNFL